MKHLWMGCVIVGACCLFFTGCFSGGSGDGSDDTENVSGVSLGSFANGAFQRGELELDATSTTNLNQGETVSVTAVVVDAFDNYYSDEINVVFSSKFADNGLAEFENTVVSTVNGIATTSYWGTGGDGTDTITASIVVNDEKLKATGSVSVVAPNVAHLEFISTSTDVIALKNTGGPGRPETAILVFKVVDEFGYSASNQIVDFTLSTSVGSLYLSNASATSGSDGLVQTTVNSGSVSTHIRVNATLRDIEPLVSIVSDELLISTGLPDQDSISISAETLNPEAWSYNNVEVPIIFQAADHFNNFVPDGTVVYFTTSQGSIDDYGTLEDGVCEVVWRSGSPRSSSSDGVFPPELGRVKILAFCIGEESFRDANGNGFFDQPDSFTIGTDMAEPFRDDNFDGSRSALEPWWDYNSDEVYQDLPNGIYNGSLCSETAEDQGLCTRELVYNQADMELIMSGSFATFGFSPSSVELTDAGQLISIFIADENNNPMPADSTVSITTTIGEIVGNTNFQIGSTNYSGPLEYSIWLMPMAGESQTSGYLSVSIETPFGNVTDSSYLPITRVE